MAESLLWLHVGDIGLNIFHTVFILFIMFGWMSKKTLRSHAIALFCVLISWLGIGYWYGFGYCFLTDWHWSIKQQLGETDLPPSFIAYFLDRVLGLSISNSTVNTLAYGFLILSIVMSTILNLKSKKTIKANG